MILLAILFLIFLVLAAVFVVTFALAILFVGACVLVVLICAGVYEFSGKWPSAHAVTTLAGLSFTGFLFYCYPHTVVLLGGAIGTALAARGASEV